MRILSTAGPSAALLLSAYIVGEMTVLGPRRFVIDEQGSPFAH
jgi:hypothetical protein